MEDLNANDADAAMKIIEGTARSMGMTIEKIEKPRHRMSRGFSFCNNSNIINLEDRHLK